MALTLMTHTRALLRESDKSLAQISHELNAKGSNISYYWLRKFSSNVFKDPSVNRIEELYEHLKGHPVIPSNTR